MVKVTTSDGESIEVNKSILDKSILLHGIIDENPDDEIPLPSITGAVFKECIKYCEYIKDHDPPQIEKPIRSTDMKETVVSQTIHPLQDHACDYELPNGVMEVWSTAVLIPSSALFGL